MADKLIVVGGGITGLTAAYIAAKSGASVEILEAGKDFGGLLNTFEIEGNKLEKYYHHFFTHDAELNWLLRELSLQDKLIYKETTMGVLRNGNIYNFNAPADLLRFSPISWLDKFRFIFSSLKMSYRLKWREQEAISAEHWLRKNAGKTSFESLWRPMLQIKFGSHSSTVPLSWMVGRMRQRIQSRKSGAEKLGYLHGSLQILLDSLLARLREMGVTLHNESRVDHIEFESDRILSIRSASKTFVADKYLFTIPSPYLSSLLSNGSQKLSKHLSGQKYFGAVCTILTLKKPLSGIYWLNIADPGYPFGGIIEHTNFISPGHYNQKHVIYLSRYFSHEEEIARLSNNEIEELMLEGLWRMFPDYNQANVVETRVFKTLTAAPVCDLNYSSRVLNMQLPIKNAFICNMQHVYPDERSTNNSVRIAAEVCKTMNLGGEEVPTGLSLSGQIGTKSGLPEHNSY